jgi:hypothetical protein
MCRDVSKTRDRGFIEVGPLELEQDDEEFPVDIWICSKCSRRFVMLEDSEKE